MTDTRLTPELLELCYRNGAFPMAEPCGGGVELYRADPRAVLELAELHVSKSLARTIRSGRYAVRVDKDSPWDIRLRRLWRCVNQKRIGCHEHQRSR